MEPTIKDIFLSVIDFIDKKLQTKTGRIALLIVSCVVFGGCLVYAYNVNKNYDDKVKELVDIKNELKITTTELRTTVKNSTADCNEQIKQGAILQQQLQAIYAGKTEENKNLIKEQELILKEKEKITEIQNTNIMNLKNLKIN